MPFDTTVATHHNWPTYIDELLTGARGKRPLTWLAQSLAKVASLHVPAVRKGLDRLRHQPDGKGGTYGALLVEHYPSTATEATGRHLGQYHGPVADLPVSVRKRLIAAQDTPFFSGLPSGGWLHVARASMAVSEERWEDASGALDRVVARPEPSVLQLEVHSVRAFVHSRNQRSRARAELDAMRALLDAPATRDAASDDLLCYEARWADQQAYEHYKPIAGVPDLDGAEKLYRALPEDGPPFVRLRRALGLSGIHLYRHDVDSAEREAAAAADLAGDLGLRRLRAQALRQLARCARGRGDSAAMDAFNQRAWRIAEALEDQNLASRIRAPT